MSPSSLGRGLLLVSTDREGKARQRPVACGVVRKLENAEEEGGGLLKTLQLGTLFGLWYLLSFIITGICLNDLYTKFFWTELSDKLISWILICNELGTVRV